MLMCRRLGFDHPYSGRHTTIVAAPDDEWRATAHRLGWSLT
jgi:hypothetical protein